MGRTFCMHIPTLWFCSVLAMHPAHVQSWIDGARVQQWPLGVATYRKFPRTIDFLAASGPNPNVTIPQLAQQRRKYLCNLQATVRMCACVCVYVCVCVCV